MSILDANLLKCNLLQAMVEKGGRGVAGLTLTALKRHWFELSWFGSLPATPPAQSWVSDSVLKIFQAKDLLR
jgi:hypothetical protein